MHYGDADAAGYGERRFPLGVKHRYRRSELLHDALRLLKIRLGKEHAELLSAVAAGQVG